MKYEFKAEVKQVLDIVIISLYTDKEIFVRELVSNASDASGKLRFLKLSGKEIVDPDAELKIEVGCDDKAGTVWVEDFGVGMTENELMENLGTIAHSGSKAFLEALKESKGELGERLIGQFGVGFYSVFMVADKVEVQTRSYDPSAKALQWTCDGSAEFEISPSDRVQRGTKIILHLKKDYLEFADKYRLRSILDKYSIFVEYPLYLNGEKLETMQPVWLKSKADVKPDEYEAFYKFREHTSEAPLDWIHFSADAPIALNALIYIPPVNGERLGFGKVKCDVGLYCKKVLIDAHPENLLPDWMRFAKGVVDCADLPMNISRESMQDSALVAKIGRIVVKKFVRHMSELAKKDAEKFSKVMKLFGSFIKEGAAMDFEHRDALMKLLRFESSSLEKGKETSFEEYVSRMKDGQKSIFYAFGADRESIESAPYLEAFKARGIEVLFLYEPIDSFVLSNLGEFDGKKFEAIDSADIELPEAPAAQGESMPDDDIKSLCEWIKAKLGSDRVESVSTGARLTESPAAALNADPINPSMRRIMKIMNPDADLPKPKVKFEINPRSDVIKNLNELRGKDENLAELVLEQLFDDSLLSAGLLENPQSMAGRINKILARVKS